MGFKAWRLGAMEEAGYMDTNEGLISRVANYFANSTSDTIDTDEFRQACINCNVDPDSFMQADLDRLQQILNQ